MSDRTEKLLRELQDVKDIIDDLSFNTEGVSVFAEAHKILLDVYMTKRQQLLNEMNGLNEAKKSKPAIYITFGRFNPLSKGHEELINYIVSEAKKDGAEHRIYTSATQDNKKNPLSFEMKTRFMKKFFKGADISTDRKLATIFDVLYDLRDKGYKDVKLFVGDDRESKMADMVRGYLNHPDKEKSLNFTSFDTPTTPPRTEGVSGTQMRAYAVDGDLKNFSANLPSKANEKDARLLFNAVRAGLEAKPKKKAK